MGHYQKARKLGLTPSTAPATTALSLAWKAITTSVKLYNLGRCPSLQEGTEIKNRKFYVDCSFNCKCCEPDAPAADSNGYVSIGPVGGKMIFKADYKCSGGFWRLTNGPTYVSGSDSCLCDNQSALKKGCEETKLDVDLDPPTAPEQGL